MRPLVTRWILVGTALGVFGCGGSSAVEGPPPPPSSPVAALDDASDRLVPVLGACTPTIGEALSALRADMSPALAASRADVDAVRAALAACPNLNSEADRAAIGLALDVAVDVLAAAGR